MGLGHREPAGGSPAITTLLPVEQIARLALLLRAGVEVAPSAGDGSDEDKGGNGDARKRMRRSSPSPDFDNPSPDTMRQIEEDE